MKNKKILFYITIFLIAFLGVFLRTKAYFASYSFWMDESSLAINIIKRGIFDLFLPLEHCQSAPPMFLVLTKILTMIFKTHENIFRTIPFLSSLISIPLFYLLSKKFLSSKFSIIFAFLLFNLNYKLIYYSNEFKQYSSDVLFCLFAFLIFSNLNLKNLSNKKIFLYGLLSSLGLLFSLPVAFIISAFLFFEIFISKINKKQILLFLSPYFITIPPYYIFNLSPSKKEMISQFNYLWNEGFINSFGDFISIIKTNISFFFESKLALLYLIILIFGFYFLFSKAKLKNKPNCLLLFFFGIVILASFFHLYPIKERVALYILPFLIIIFSVVIDNLFLKNKFKTLLAFLCFLILFQPLFSIYKQGIFKTIEYEKTYAKQMLITLKQNYKNNEILVYNDASASSYEFYSNYYNFQTDKFIRINLSNYNKEFYFDLLKHLKPNKTYWFYYPADYSQRPVISFIKEWANDKNKIIKEYNFKRGYLAKIQIVN